VIIRYFVIYTLSHPPNKGDFRMPTIRVEDDIFAGLKTLAEPFTDTPNSVIRRLLEEKGVLTKLQSTVEAHPNQSKSDTKKPTATKNNSLTPQPIYEKFLHYVLATQFHGSGEKKEVTSAVINLMKSKGFISSEDLKEVSTGETKAENTIAWGRNALKDNLIISKDFKRGIWELTREGMQKAKNIVLPENPER